MKKRILAITALLLYCLLACMPAFAAGDDLLAPTVPEYYVFGTEYFLLTDDEVNHLNAQAEDIFTAYGVEVFIARNDALEGDIITYAAETFGQNTSTGDGLILVLTSTEWYIYTSERMSAMIPEEDVKILWEAFRNGDTDYEHISAYLGAVRDILDAKVLPEARLLPRLVDDANILSRSEEADLLEMLDEISERQQFDVVVVTINSTGGKDIMAYADDFYDYNGYGFGNDFDGVILVVDMGGREWSIVTTGFGITAITDAGRDYMADKFSSYLSDGDYYESFEVFAEMCDDYVTQAKEGEPYDRGNLPKEPVSWLWLPGSLLIGAVPSGIVSGGMKRQLKTVRSKIEADSYVDQSVSTITRRDDVFLYRNVNRTRIVHSDGVSSRSGGGSSTHFGSSGRMHGGGSGRF